MSLALPRADADAARRPARRRPAPSAIRDLLLVALTVSSGTVDAISFLAFGKVFTAFMTGNIVFLGLGVAGAKGPDVVRVAVSLAAFAAGVRLSVRIIKPPEGSAMWPRRVSAGLGVTALAQAGFLAGWLATSGHPATAAGDLLVALSALAMGVQMHAVRTLGIPGVSTTAATLTVDLFVSGLGSGSRSAAERRRLGLVLLALCTGAAAGGALLVHARTYAPVLPLIATLLVIATASLALEPAQDR